MLIAIIATLLNQSVLNYEWILVGIIAGSLIGAIAAQKVAMTDMPQMVGIFNGVGGAASALVAVGEFWRLLSTTGTVPLDATFIAILGVLIGGVTLTGSILAFAKLQGLVSGSPVTFPFQQPFNALLLASFLAGSVYLLIYPEKPAVFLTLTAIS
jgi:NAD(P) transhydrogenase subunit beta